MTEERRIRITEDLFEEILSLSKAKAADYASNDETLRNFLEGAKTSGLTPIEYWRVLFSKHAQSIQLAIEKNPILPSTETEPLEGRIHDAIIYLILLLCLMEDPGARDLALENVEKRIRSIEGLQEVFALEAISIPPGFPDPGSQRNSGGSA
jgi:hypothetical protein